MWLLFFANLAECSLTTASSAKLDLNSRGASRNASFSSISDLDQSSSGSEVEVSWISWFCSLRGHDFFSEVDERFVEDDFNLTGLPGVIPNYDFARDMILDLDVNYDLSPDQAAKVERSAELLYGLIHARFVITARFPV